jgi:hypothetical protein
MTSLSPPCDSWTTDATAGGSAWRAEGGITKGPARTPGQSNQRYRDRLRAQSVPRSQLRASKERSTGDSGAGRRRRTGWA